MAKRPASAKMLAHLARLNADPEARARALVGIRAKHADKAWKARVAQATRIARSDPKVYTLVNVRTGERRQGTRADFRRWFGWTVDLVHDIVGEKTTRKGWRLAPLDAPKRSQPRTPELLGPKEPPKGNLKLRPCLGPLCRGETFWSAGPHNRICARCRASLAGMSGRFVYHLSS